MRSLDTHTWMLATALDLLDHAQGLRRQSFRLGPAHEGPLWEPPVDMVDSGDCIRLLVALPGVAPDCFDVRMEQCAIVVRGQRSFGSGIGSGAIVRLEIPYGRFERRVALPPGAYRVCEAQMENGCLRVDLERMP